MAQYLPSDQLYEPQREEPTATFQVIHIGEGVQVASSAESGSHPQEFITSQNNKLSVAAWIVLGGTMILMISLYALLAIPTLLVSLWLGAAVLPTFLVYLWVVVPFKGNPQLSLSFIIEQLGLGAYPAFILALFVEVGLSIGLQSLLGFDMSSASEQIFRNPLSIDEALRDKLWQLLLFYFLNAMVVAAFVEETVKYILALRHRKLVISPGIKGIIGCSVCGALGLAGMEHLFYCLNFLLSSDWLTAVLSGFFRAIIAFWLHCLTGFFIGLRRARVDILGDSLSYFSVIWLPVLVHGTMDFTAFSLGTIFEDTWLVVLVPCLDIFLLSIFTWTTSMEYKSTSEREMELRYPQNVATEVPV
ncbi:hypothetical protein GpartN1_g5294.t1 [Galdieria partita]|uniref:PrsW family intramembrane metalloprotease n=1 Tax=Galdieria partita TaxID=83374 RepID=A0A9C7PZ78_9RHOD|nr:hypothetical protein GpartN1_g5294.t1 [Galdieria partita]